MKARCLLTIVLIGLPMYWWWQGIPSSADTTTRQALASERAPLPGRFMGAGSCAAAACHNGNFATGNTGSEYTTWITQDRHAKAYEVLFDELSNRIQKNLHASTMAHEDQRCLKCHVAPDYDAKKPPPDAPYFKTDGVSCESCHGGAKNWLAFHHLDSWQGKTPNEKKRAGMNDTQSLAGRAQVCVTCHVGAPGLDVNHDLIAAGHPRLNFEFAAFHAFMPRHWPDAKDRDPATSPRGHVDFEARAWLLGQLVTAQAALELLADRAGEKAGPWPEFAEFDCAACHHDLQSPSARQKSGYGKRKPGALQWGHSTVLAPLALEGLKDPGSRDARAALHEIRKHMDAGNLKREAIAKNATKAAALFQAILSKTNDSPISLEDMLRKLLAEKKARAAGTRDEATQVHLALSAIRLSYVDTKRPIPEELRLSLLPLGPRSFDPQVVRKRFEESRK